VYKNLRGTAKNPDVLLFGGGFLEFFIEQMRVFHALLRQKTSFLFILSLLPDDAIHVSGFGGEDGSVT
jgi:hypothetical protein